MTCAFVCVENLSFSDWSSSWAFILYYFSLHSIKFCRRRRGRHRRRSLFVPSHTLHSMVRILCLVVRMLYKQCARANTQRVYKCLLSLSLTIKYDSQWNFSFAWFCATETLCGRHHQHQTMQSFSKQIVCIVSHSKLFYCIYMRVLCCSIVEWWYTWYKSTSTSLQFFIY